MNWEAVSAVSSAFTGLVIVITAVVGIYQLRQLGAQRRDAAAVEVMRSLQDADFVRSFDLIMRLDPGASEADLHRLGREYEIAAQILALRFEMLGVLVFRGAVAFDVTEDLCGGGVLSVWLRLNALAFERRRTQDYPMYLEWFQWLAEQFERRNRLHQTPAHERHSSWKPNASPQ
ncbi:MAG TPA: hypothetical protein VFA29_15985 [Candidatus Baltobacteraceae bacterium]|nr:hypothetical protein [Candidatus Baltobacteraceae bacterium]